MANGLCYQVLMPLVRIWRKVSIIYCILQGYIRDDFCLCDLVMSTSDTYLIQSLHLLWFVLYAEDTRLFIILSGHPEPMLPVI